ncbi:MAG: ABC transporter ATP-binding protein/permease [Planctomycetales bacterium]|nr:ABC transporter ATP-binding protein/permease [Planctomycetales bacterium]
MDGNWITENSVQPTNADGEVIVCNRLTRHFGKLVAVEDLSFTVRRGAIFGMLGPNGSGKSTMIRMMLGILPPTLGSSSILGLDSQIDAEQIKSRIGYMSQSFSLYGDLTVQENIDFYARVYGLHKQQLASRREDVLLLTGLGNRLSQLAGTLSGGWKQRLALACALIHEPEVLFLDEPTAGIDPVARRQLWDLLFELSGRGVTLFVTTHYMDEAERCTDVGYIYNSRLLVSGKPSQLKHLPLVTPAGTGRYELEIEEPARWLVHLRDNPLVRDATLFGQAIHLLVETKLNPQDLYAQLQLPDSIPAQVRDIAANLEDVFVSLTKLADQQPGYNPQMHAEQAVTDENASIPESPIPRSRDQLAQTKESVIVNEKREPKTATSNSSHSASQRPAPGEKRLGSRTPLSGLWAVLVKEFVHIRRQPTTIFFMLVIPVIQTIIFGFAIDTQIENIPLVVYDLDGRQPARALVERFANTRRFHIAGKVWNDDAFYRALSSGNAKAALKIPSDYTDRLLRGELTQLQFLVDGSDSQTATTAQSTAQLLGLNMSIALAKQKGEAMQIAPARDSAGRGVLPIEIRTRMLFNPDLESSYFFVPGLVGVILQLVTLFLTSFTIVRERELGTLEQLFVTPVSRAGLMLGKLVPYAAVGFATLIGVLFVMTFVFQVPIAGNLALLLALSMLFVVCSLGLGLLVSTVARSQLEAMQFAFVLMLPSILLSGFMFPRSEMPNPIYAVTFAIPATYFIEILRAIVLRAADFQDLAHSVLGLLICTVVILSISIFRFQKRLA